ncbi:MAG: formate hydrogenlyase, partial [Candidatus Bathyarchaeia archaeon]
AVSTLIGFLTLIGLPTTSGFISEWMIFGGVIRSSLASGSVEKLIVAVLGLLATMLTAGYGLWTVRRVFFGSIPTHLEEVREGSMLALAPIIALAILTFIVGIYPAPILDRLTQTVMLSLNLS